MTFDSRAPRLFGLLSATAVAAPAMATLLPTKWVPRTGLGWQVEHFLVYFTTTRMPDFTAALGGAAGAISAAMLVKLFFSLEEARVWRY